MTGYTDQEDRAALERLRRDMDRIELVGGGQGRSPEEVQASTGAWLAILLVCAVLFVLSRLAGCGTVAGVGRDLMDISNGVRAEMSKEER